MNYTSTRRIVAVAALVVLVPLAAAAQNFTANLTGDSGSGFASIQIAGETIDYSILFSGLENATEASITNGSDVTIVLTTSFTGGSAIGQTSSADAPMVAADPSAFSVEVTNGSDTLSGMLEGAPSHGVTLYYPVVATVAGQAGTDFHTDARVVNRSSGPAMVAFEFFRQTAGGVSEPTATAEIEIAANEQAVLDDMATELFGVTNGSGAVRITSDRAVSATARIYNDQRNAGDGTFGQFVQGLPMGGAVQAGTIAFLSNEDPNSGEGFRSNIGWFNPNDFDVNVVLSGWDASGALLGTVEHTAGGYEQLQRNLGQLWPALSTYGNLYVTFTADAPVFFYGSVVDNVNGDAIYVPATE